METVWIVAIVVVAVAVLAVSILYRGRLTDLFVKIGRNEFGMKATPDDAGRTEGRGFNARRNRMRRSTITAPGGTDASVDENKMDDSVIEIRDAGAGSDEHGD